MTGINKIDTAGANLIKSFEKCVLKAYALGDGKITIGWGNTYYENGNLVLISDVITQERADQLFLNTISRFEIGVNGAVRSALTQNQFNACVSFSYNLGLGSFNSSTLLKEINTNPHDPDIRNQFMRWVSPGTKFEAGLRIRRAAEANLYFTA